MCLTARALEDVGDHSAFVGDISERLPKQFEPIAAHLSKIHYRFFCDKFVQSFVTRFVAEVHKCRKISERGAQQLLLDTALIKTTLLEAPVVAGHGRQVPTAYSNYVLNLGLMAWDPHIFPVMSPCKYKLTRIADCVLICINHIRALNCFSLFFSFLVKAGDGQSRDHAQGLELAGCRCSIDHSDVGRFVG